MLQKLLTLATAVGETEGEPNLAFLCFFGVAVVFCGLVILIGVISLMNYFVDKFSKKATVENSAPAPAPVPAVSAEIPNRGEIIAAVCAAVAEENGTDISAIRVVSFKKI